MDKNRISAPKEKIKVGKSNLRLLIIILCLIFLLFIFLFLFVVLTSTFVEPTKLIIAEVTLDGDLEVLPLGAIFNYDSKEIEIEFTYIGAQMNTVLLDESILEEKNINIKCFPLNLKNYQTKVSNNSVQFLTGEIGLITFSCKDFEEWDHLEGFLEIIMIDKNLVKSLSKGDIRLAIQ